MFTHAIDPTIITVAGLEVRYYGLVYVFGFIFLYWYLGRTTALTETQRDTFTLYSVLGVIIGSRVFTYLFWYPATLLQDPLALFKIWQGGMSFHGGLLGMSIAGYYFAKHNDISFYELADNISIPAAAFLGLGRIANFINAELVGTVTDKSWCVNFPNHDGCRHPYQLYAAAKNFVVATALHAWNVTRELRPGTVFWSFIAAYNGLRILVDFTRDEATYAFLSVGQWISLVFLGVAVAVFITRQPE